MTQQRETTVASPDPIVLLKELVAGAHPDAAYERLTTIPDADLVNAGLLALARLFRDMRFLPGELYLAPIIEAAHARQAAEVLTAADIYLRANDVGRAQSALLAALELGDLSGQLQTLTGLAIRLRNREICGIVGDLIIADTVLPLAQKIRIGVHFAIDCNGIHARDASLRCLRQLWDLADDDAENLERIVTGLITIREFSMALCIQEKLVSKEPENVLRELKRIEIQSRIDPDAARNALGPVLARPRNTAAFWEQVSLAQQFIPDLDGAIDAMEHAIACGASEISARRRLCALLINRGHNSAAIGQIRTLLSGPELTPQEMRQLADLANLIGDARLTLDCAVRQFTGNETSAAAYLHLVVSRNNVNDGAGAANMLRAVCDGTSVLATPTAAEWSGFIKEAGRMGRGDFEARLVELALKDHPGDHGLLPQQAEILRRQRVLGNGRVAASAAPAKQPCRLARLFGAAYKP